MKDEHSMYSKYTNTSISCHLHGVFGMPEQCAIVFLNQRDYYIKFVDEESGIYEVVHEISYNEDGRVEKDDYTRKVRTDFQCLDDVKEFITKLPPYERFKEYIQSYGKLTVKLGVEIYEPYNPMEGDGSELPF